MINVLRASIFLACAVICGSIILGREVGFVRNDASTAVFFGIVAAGAVFVEVKKDQLARPREKAQMLLVSAFGFALLGSGAATFLALLVCVGPLVVLLLERKFLS